MNARILSAGLAGVALISLALGCERGTPASTVLAAKTAGLSPNFSASASNHHMRWDIISVNFGTGTLSAGGVASARANLDLSKITLTGSGTLDRKSTRLNSSHLVISYAVFCLKKKKNALTTPARCARSTIAGDPVTAVVPT